MDILSLLNQSIAADGSFVWILSLSFIAGVLISFTPCIYPMIPITIGIMQTQAANSLWRGFSIGLCYVLGLATVYAILGVISASTPIIFGQWMANPWFIGVIVLLFLYFAFSLLGFYDIFTVNLLSGSSQTGKISNPFLKSFLSGLLAGTVASPCLTPALAALLTLVAQKGSIVLGFFSMFLFAFGMGFLLIFVGMFSASLSFLPRAGEWMNDIKKFMGFIMLGVCVYMLKPLVSTPTLNTLYAAVCASASIYYFYTARYAKLRLIPAVIFASLVIYFLLF
jgi:thiol:disulfide interchange protein DsbD